MSNLHISSKTSPPTSIPTTAKIFMNGRSQAVRLPLAYRFDTDEVYISRDETTGNIILSAKPKKINDWNSVFQAISELQVDDVAEFLDTPKDDREPKDVFGDWHA